MSSKRPENCSTIKEEELGVDNLVMELDYEQYAGQALDLADVVISTDLSEIVDSMCQESIQNQDYPESPPDSGSEHLLSPGSSMINPGFVGSVEDYTIENPSATYTSSSMLPDLSKVNYSVPMQMIEDDYKSIVVHGGSVLYKDQSEQQTLHGKRRRTTVEESSLTLPAHKAIKTELPLSPDQHLTVVSPSSSNLTSDSCYHFPNSIKFHPFFSDKWVKMSTGRLVDLSPPRMTVTADKGFNFSAQDDAFIVQKKNHFQLTCEIQLDAIPRFVRRANDGTLAEIAYLQVNFYGVKSDIPSTQIKVEQSQADRSKKEFVPLRLDLNSKNQGPSFQVTVGRLHFAETTSNNMRKKGKPNPAQKYFQLVIALEAVIMNGVNKTCYDVARMASEKVIVRASNPGQFESDNEPPWNRDMSSDTVFHMGRVAINTEQGSEALTVHGNIQVSGQVMQPSDSRIKTVLKEVDPKEQLQNVNKLRIVQYKYKPEFLHQLPRQDRHRLDVPQTGVIAQDIRKVIPDAVSSNGSYILANGKEVDDMLIVNKDRLFLENLGAVRELSKVTGHLGLRVDDLEKANESVSVRLSKLHRGGSIKSTTSSTIHDFQPPTSKRKVKTLFQNKFIQVVLLALIAVIAVSLVSIATVYIMDYHHRENDPLLAKINGTKTTIIEPSPTEPLASTPRTSTTTTWTTTTFNMIPREVPILGALSSITEENCNYGHLDKCQVYCCPSHFNDTEDHVESAAIVFLVEPSLSTTTVPTTLSTADKKQLIDQLLNAEDMDSSAKDNQVLDDVLKPSLDIKETEKVSDLKPESALVDKPGLKQIVKPVVNVTPTKSLKKEDNDNEVDIGVEHFNEVLDYDEESNEMSGKPGNDTSSTMNITDEDFQQPQRAKRDITFGDLREQLGHLVTGLVRTIRDTGHTLLDKKQQKVHMYLTGSSSMNITLDNRFCDRSSSSNQLHDCLQGVGYNTSLEIPISRHFSDPFVTLVFSPPNENFVMCPLDSDNLYNCDSAHQDPDLSAVTEVPDPGTFQVHVGLFSSIQVKFRLMKRYPRNTGDTGQARRNLCSLSSDNKLGEPVREFNLRFYRVCTV